MTSLEFENRLTCELMAHGVRPEQARRFSAIAAVLHSFEVHIDADFADSLEGLLLREARDRRLAKVIPLPRRTKRTDEEQRATVEQMVEPKAPRLVKRLPLRVAVAAVIVLITATGGLRIVRTGSYDSGYAGPQLAEPSATPQVSNDLPQTETEAITQPFVARTHDHPPRDARASASSTPSMPKSGSDANTTQGECSTIGQEQFGNTFHKTSRVICSRA
jgi:hypothetical protein